MSQMQINRSIESHKQYITKYWYPNKFSFYHPQGLKNNSRILFIHITYTYHSMQQKYNKVKT